MKKENEKSSVIVRGGGDLATGVTWVLRENGFPVVIAELPAPRAVRRAVSFCEAVYDGWKIVEGLEAVLCHDAAEAWRLCRRPGKVALVVDPDLEALCDLPFDTVVDARMMKKPPASRPPCAFHWIGIGPGFCAGRDVDAVIETHREDEPGKVIFNGPALPDTGIPGVIGGESARRVVRSPGRGIFNSDLSIGLTIEEGQRFGWIETSAAERVEVSAPIAGKIRGLIRPGTAVDRGDKIGDVDPRGAQVDHLLISDKAKAVGRGTLEALLQLQER